MLIELPGNLAPTTSLRAVIPLQWVVNQQLTAEVIGLPRENYTRLNIGGTMVTARTDLPLVLGQKIALTVAKVAPTIVLKVSAPIPAPDTAAIHRALVRVLPVQSSLPETVHLLRELATLVHKAPIPQVATPHPERWPAIRERVADFVQKLPVLDQLIEPKSLRSVLIQTALPTEARLNTAAVEGRKPDLNADIRWQLARVGQQLELPRLDRSRAMATLNRSPAVRGGHHAPIVPSPHAPISKPIGLVSHGTDDTISNSDSNVTRLRQFVDATVARLQAHQLQNLSAPGTTSLVVELPLLRGVNIDLLRFDYDDKSDSQPLHDDSEPRADLTLSLHMADGKEFAAQIRMTGGAMNIRVGSNDATMNALIEQRLETLRRGIEQHGIGLSGLAVGPVKIDSRPRVEFDHLVNDKV